MIGRFQWPVIFDLKIVFVYKVVSELHLVLLFFHSGFAFMKKCVQLSPIRRLLQNNNLDVVTET